MKYYALALAAGCAAAYYLLPAAALPWAAVMAAVLGLALLFWRKRRRWGALVLCAALGLGWYYGYARLFYGTLRSLEGQTAALTVTAAEDGVFTERGQQRVPVRSGNTAAMLYLEPGTPPVKAGDSISADAVVTEVRNPSYAMRLVARGAAVVLPPENRPVWIWPQLWKRAVSDRLSHFLPVRASALVNALLLGDTGLLTAGEMDALRESGLAHAVSVSGLHVSTIAGFVLLLTGRRKKRALLALPVIVLFVLTAGAPASAVRAGLMQTSFLIGGILGRDENPLGALELALAALLLWNPSAVADVGLQLSFAAALGLILYARPLQSWLHRKKLPNFLASSLAASLSALLFSTPICAVVFGKISLAAPLSNLLCLWAVNGLFIGGLALLALSLVWMPAAVFLGTPLSWLGEYLTRVSGLLARIPYASVYTSQFFIVLWLVLAYALLLLFFLRRDREPMRPWVLGALLGGTLTLALLLTTLRTGLAPLEITVLDVGQGQSVLVQSGHAAALIDCGSHTTNAARAASSALRARGLGSLEYLLLTHGHSDHVSGVNELVAQISVQGVLGPSVTASQADGVLPYVAPVTAKTELPLGNAALILLPPPSLGSGNEQCMSVFIRQGDFVMGLTGDLGTADENRLLSLYELPVCNVLVAGHHGSAYSAGAEWLKALRPQAAAISVGSNNYGHPAPEAMGRMTLVGAKIFRTDLGGNITIRVNAA